MERDFRGQYLRYAEEVNNLAISMFGRFRQNFALNAAADTDFRKPAETCIDQFVREKTPCSGSLLCQCISNVEFIVEIQKTKQKFFKDRSVYYSTFPIVEQAEQGDWNFELKAVYTVAILDFTFYDEDRDKTVVSHVQLMDTKKQTVFFKKLTFIYLQMPNFNKSEDELEDHFDKWLYVFKNLPRLQERPRKLQERVFERLFSIAEITRFSPVEREEYEESLKVYRDMKNSLDTAREEGRGERELEIARMMLQDGEDSEKIARYTGLSVERIEDLKKRLG